MYYIYVIYMIYKLIVYISLALVRFFRLQLREKKHTDVLFIDNEKGCKGGLSFIPSIFSGHLQFAIRIKKRTLP